MGRKLLKLDSKLKGEIGLFFNIKKLDSGRKPFNLKIQKKSSKRKHPDLSNKKRL